MKRKIPQNKNLIVFRIPLVNLKNMKHEVVILSQKIDFNMVEKDISVCYPGDFCTFNQTYRRRGNEIPFLTEHRSSWER